MFLSTDIWEPAARRDGLDHALLRGLLDVRSRQRRHLRIVKIVLRGGKKRPHAKVVSILELSYANPYSYD